MTPARGRPRSERIDARIVEATVELLGEVGLRGLSLEKVAQRAGVSTMAVYRRHGGVDDLMEHLCRRPMSGAPEVPDTGSLRGDLETFATQAARVLSREGVARAALEQLAAAAAYPRVEALLAEGIAARRADLSVVVERARARGEVREGVTADTVFDLLTGALNYRALFPGRGRERTAEVVPGLVDVVVRGVAP